MRELIGDPREEIERAQAGLAGIATRTPLIDAEGFDQPVRLKAEYLQPVRAFKLRGAWTAVSRLDDESRSRGVVTSSSGNHGYALAWSASRMGIPATIVMPQSTPSIKQDNIRSVGGTVCLIGETRGPEQYTEATRIAEDEGRILIPPFDHPDVIIGQATCAAELIQDWPEVESIVVPVGGGGLLAGTCLAAQASGRPIRVIAVEPERIPKLSRAIEAGSPVDLPHGTSLADGMLTRSVGSVTWPIIKGNVSEVVQVSDSDIVAALRWLNEREIVVEPSGAASLAALVGGSLSLSGPTAFLISGGNVDPEYHDQLVG